ncbi:MAG: hypothetical protein NUV96_01305 [Candidatus Colwellbacteria bacterium]|nr:hypothetical protein [Candidatus Colwellbacteria bacterium]
MERFLIRVFWMGGIVLLILGVLSFYVRFQTLKYDMRADRGDSLEIGE